MLSSRIIMLIGLSISLILTDAKAQHKKQIRQLTLHGNELYLIGKYHEALDLFLQADQLKPNQPILIYSIGLCYSKTDQKLKAIPYLEQAKKDGLTYPNIDFHLGDSYLLAHKFNEAITCLEDYRKNVNPADNDEKYVIDQLISNCRNGLDLSKNPVDVKITNMGPIINSKFPDYKPSISADESTMIFTSRRDNSTGGKLDELDKHFYEDIYSSDKVNGQWTSPVDIQNGINTETHDACIGLSPDGQEMFIYKWSHSSEGDIYVSDLKGSTWSTPKNLGTNINSDYWDSNASITADNRFLFFTSKRKSIFGEGQKDIYMAKRLSNGEFAAPKLLGSRVNTNLDEDAPFIHADGKTLYFSSKGHKSMGGFDIFSCTINTETWEITSDPVNVGFPINTADDDVFFVWSADNKRAYFASEREGGYGEKDIYMLERKDADAALVILKGSVTNCDKKSPINAKITISDNATGLPVGIYNTNSSSGNYIVIMPAGKNYGVAVDAPGYSFYSKNIDIPLLDHYEEIKDEICLEKIKSGTKIVLHNVFFDAGKATLRSESQLELERLLDMLNNNKEMKIQISGHTDSDGNDEFNLKLSTARAQAVANYLAGKGIDSSRLTYKGFGETKPIVPNDSPDNHQLNRRTEIEILD